MNTTDIDCNLIRVKHPKRIENIMIGKIYYGDSSKDKLQLRICNAKVHSVTSIDTVTFIKFVVNKSIGDIISNIEDKLIQITKACKNDWFQKNKISNALVDDYYSSILSYKKDVGFLLTIKLFGCNHDIITYLEQTRVDIVITIRQLRFSKDKFYLLCEIEKGSNEYRFLSLDNDTTSEERELDDNEDDELGLDTEEIDKIRSDILQNLHDTFNHFTKLSTEINNSLAKCKMFIEQLSTDDHVSLLNLDMAQCFLTEIAK